MMWNFLSAPMISVGGVRVHVEEAKKEVVHAFRIIL